MVCCEVMPVVEILRRAVLVLLVSVDWECEIDAEIDRNIGMMGR